MRISRIVSNLVLLAFVSVAATASASDCNMRNGSSRFASTNPEISKAGSVKKSAGKKVRSAARKGRK